jgi:leucyl-tRNA synthetase
VLHLLYSRFWHKVLFDLGYVSTAEPFLRLVNQGLILGEMEFHVFENGEGVPVSTTALRDVMEEATKEKPVMIAFHRTSGEKCIGRRVDEEEVERRGTEYVLKGNPEIRVDARSFKMSKSRGNVANPDDLVRDYGADALRLYVMYMGPLEMQKPWNTRDIIGMVRFLNAVWRNLVGDDEEQNPSTPVREPSGSAAGVQASPAGASNNSNHHNHTFSAKVRDIPIPDALDRMMHRTIKKVGDDAAALRFNTAIAELIKLNNELNKLTGGVPRELAENLTLMLAPFAPHIAEEIWHRLGHHKSLSARPWPTYDPAKLTETTMELPVQVNGKLRDKITVPADADPDSILAAAQSAAGVQPWVSGKQIKKKLYVPKKLVNFVVG